MLLNPKSRWLLGLLLLGVALECRCQDDDDSNVLPESDPELVPGAEMVGESRSHAPAEVINRIGEREFREKYASRCGKSTKLELKAEEIPHLQLICSGPIESDIRFSLNTTKEEMIAAGFDPSTYSTIWVHGWTQHPKSKYMRKQRDLLQNLGNAEKANFFIFDYGLAGNVSYPEAAARTSGLGNYLAVFLEKLIDAGQDRMKIHLLGHSLGGPVSAFAGKRIRPPIGRITAVDTAGPCFGSLLWDRKDDRITPTDAYQVDAYHFDKLAGNINEISAFDVYVNGGKSQPGCDGYKKTAVKAIYHTVTGSQAAVSPSHTRASMVSTVPLEEGKCQQVAYECQDYKSFKRGLCGSCGHNQDSCFVMGFPFQYKSFPEPAQKLRRATSSTGKRLFITLGDNEHYCSNNYQVLLNFEFHEDTFEGANHWRPKITLRYEVDGQPREVKAVMKGRPKDNVYSYLLVEDDGPFRVTSAEVSVDNLLGRPVSIRGTDEGAGYRVDSVEINYLSNIEPEVRAEYSSRLCYASDVTERQKLRFTEC